MRKIFLLLTLLLGFQAMAQIDYGVKAGVIFNNFPVSEAVFDESFGYELGGMAEYKLNRTFGLHTEFLLAYFQYDLYNSNIKNLRDFRNYISIPFLIQTSITKKFRFDLGIRGDFLVREKITGPYFDEVWKGNVFFNPAIVSGFSFRSYKDLLFQLHLAFDPYLDRFKSDDFSLSHYNVTFSVGYFLN
ncbi:MULTISPECIES: outer membrane beta-barrel protein [unclassified Leeuwenhoekiella]|uniref:outer membrane beta-barrel protein n=1 Tax=unclassified Leeuwenhoekiella TaxID=2615029 RepID=UPI000C6AE846|nr:MULTISPECIES: outer membrane beta-barrel protein [unclassified Leeuwenhoekiella]MAW97124.1 hypothetical protein [Leeuwenhoekiella sp.]MBA82640.1 hypothetical protein [Leeuwenhoekiella sp.]|tara:strand:- start:18384 stop:18947 length:564 start_codon:yes stop_codon:yes gene_type:complete